jgi:hypothetical protein
MGQHRPRQRFVDRTVERVVERLLSSLPEVLTHSVEDDDGVVQRVAEHGEKASHDGQGDLEMHQLEERYRREDVVTGRNNRGCREAPLEANREVDERNEE